MDLDELNRDSKLYFENIFAQLPSGYDKLLRKACFRAGEPVIQDMDRVEQVFFLLSGSAYALNKFSNGDVYQYARFEAPCIFGEYEIYADSEWYRGTIICETDCQFVCISAKYFLQWVKGNPEFLFQRTCELTRSLLRQVRSERNRLFYRGIDRLCLLLYSVAVQQESGVRRVKCTRRKLAELIGCSTKTIQRCLNTMEDEGLLSISGHSIEISAEQWSRLIKARENIIEGNSEEV